MHQRGQPLTHLLFYYSPHRSQICRHAAELFQFRISSKALTLDIQWQINLWRV